MVVTAQHGHCRGHITKAATLRRSWRRVTYKLRVR